MGPCARARGRDPRDDLPAEPEGTDAALRSTAGLRRDCATSLPRPTRPKTYVAVYFCEQPPEAESRVTLSRDIDRLGMRRLISTGASAMPSGGACVDFSNCSASSSSRAGSVMLDRVRRRAAVHGCIAPYGHDADGATRTEGVVDADCRVHGIAEFVSSRAVRSFPCAGHANPTLTIVALCLRLCESQLARPY